MSSFAKEARATYELVRTGELHGTAPALVGEGLRAALSSNGHHRLTAAEAAKQIRQARDQDGFAFDFLDLSEMVRDGVEPPKMLLDGLLYERASHWFSGHPKHGKTILLMHAAIELIERGHHVIWLDYEGGARRTARRLGEMAARPDAVAEFFHYQYAPRTTADDSVIGAFEATLEKWPGALVVFDSQAKALSRAGLSEDKADDVTKWTTRLVLNLANTKSATVAVIDHVTKVANSRSSYARGSGAKAADADVSWFVERKSEFNRQRSGSIEVTLWHDRDGEMPERLVFKIGDGDGGLPVVRIVDATEQEAKGVREQILDALRGAKNGLSQTQVEGMVPGRASVVRDELRALAADTDAPVTVKPAPRNSLRYHFQEPTDVAQEPAI